MANEQHLSYGKNNISLNATPKTGENLNVLLNTDPAKQVPAPDAYFSLEDMVTILGYPRQVDLQVEDAMGTFTVFIGHTPIILKLSPEGEGIHPPKWRP